MGRFRAWGGWLWLWVLTSTGAWPRRHSPNPTRAREPMPKGQATGRRSGKRRTKAAAKGQQAVCGQPKSNGEPCTQLAGNGTEHPGEGPCMYHEPARAGASAVVSASGGGLASPVNVSPTQAITGVLQLAAGQLVYVSAEVAALEAGQEWNGDGEGGQLNRWVRWQHILMDKVARYASTAVGMGVAERQVRLAEEQTRLMGKFMEAVAGDLKLTPAQRKLLGPAIRKNMDVVLSEANEIVKVAS